jgi:hypothetical protein
MGVPCDRGVARALILIFGSELMAAESVSESGEGSGPSGIDEMLLSYVFRQRVGKTKMKDEDGGRIKTLRR